MRTIDVGCDLRYRVENETSFLFQVSVARGPHQRVVKESLLVNPSAALDACRVGLFGNRMHRTVMSSGEITLRYRASVGLDPDVVPTGELRELSHAELPAEVLPYLNPSRYCESDLLMQYAWDEFSAVAPGHERVRRITHWVSEQLAYTPGSTGANTTACDVLLKRRGVCRDYAHLAIALCRAMGIPARYVAGYAVDLQPPDFHGFFEVFLGGTGDPSDASDSSKESEGSWYLFDATELAPVSGFVRIGAGRDAADVSFATLIGSAQIEEMTVWAHEAGPGEAPRHGEQAVSTA